MDIKYEIALIITKTHITPIEQAEEILQLIAKNNQALQLQQIVVSGSTDIPKPYKWLKEEKWKIPQGTTYYDPKVTLTQCASWMMEYIAKYYR